MKSDDALIANILSTLFHSYDVRGNQLALDAAKTSILAWHQAAIDAAVKGARVDEVHNFGNWNADKGYVDLFDAIDSRLKQLNQPQEKK